MGARELTRAKRACYRVAPAEHVRITYDAMLGRRISQESKPEYKKFKKGKDLHVEKETTKSLTGPFATNRGGLCHT